MNNTHVKQILAAFFLIGLVCWCIILFGTPKIGDWVIAILASLGALAYFGRYYRRV